MHDDCADNLLKGIPSEQYIEGESVKWTLFVPPTGVVVNGWKESSINWEDDDGAVDELLSRRKGNGLHFKAGAVRIPRSRVDRIIAQFHAIDKFSYERKQHNGNKYHGNLLFAEKITNELRLTICGCLAGAVEGPRINQKGE